MTFDERFFTLIEQTSLLFNYLALWLSNLKNRQGNI